MTTRTKVLIVDDHPVVRQGLRAVLSTQPDLEIVGEAEDGEKAVEFARNRRPDVVLMDVVMPACNGEKATRRIMRFQPECKVLALSSYTDDQSVQQMLQAGVAGYLTKQSAADELIKAIRTIRAGKGHCFSPDIAATAHRLKQACSNGRAWDKSLTALESQVLKLIAAGLTNRMIAVQLQLSEPEVKGCRERVMDKLTIRSIADLTRYAVANGLVPLNEIPAREANGATPAQVPVRLSSAAAHNEGGACLVEEPTPDNLAKAIERSVCADDDFSFRLRHGPFGLQQSTPDREHRTYLTRTTHREREVIIALAEGLTNKEVAARLRVGVRTIETHRENLKRKLKINNVAGITKFALARGWITIPGQRLAETSERWGVDPIQIASARMEPRPTMPDRALILIVEDNEVDLMLIRRAFAKAKVLNPLFNVQTGEEAIAYLKGDERYANRAEYPLPDLVLLDLKLTGISGFQVLKWIRQQPGLKAMRVVVLTGSTAIEDINLAYQLGANSFLAKPMDFDSFVQVAGAVAGYWIWMNETPEVSRSVEGVKGSGANIGSTSGESLPE